MEQNAKQTAHVKQSKLTPSRAMVKNALCGGLSLQGLLSISGCEHFAVLRKPSRKPAQNRNLEESESLYQDLHHLPFFQLLDPLPQVLPQPHGQAMRAVGSQGQGKTQ